MNTVIKINSKIDDNQIKNIINKCKEIEGVIDVNINKLSNVLSYELTKWSSDYDVMVAVINILESFNIDSEPLFEGAEEMVHAVNQHDHCEQDNCDNDCHCEHEHCDHECCDNEHGSELSFCSCHSNETNEGGGIKSKIIELSVSVVLLIIGIILSGIESTIKFSDYVIVVAFAVAGYESVINGIVGIFKLKPFSETTLMTIASISAMFLGETIEAAGIMILFSIGEVFERAVTSDATKIINALKSYRTEKVKIIGDGGIEITVSPDRVKIGDIIVLRAGEKLAVDGVIIEGSSSFDTKVITGENAYKDLSVNDQVLSGFTSVDGTVKIRAEKTFDDSAVSKIAKIVESSAQKKSKPEKFLEKFAKWYTPCIVIVAIIIAFIPPIFSAVYLSGLKVWGVRAVMLLCISCPCSLVISIPLAYFMGVANAAKKGVIIKNSACLEKLSKVKTVVFDKTGTLTEGVLTVTKVVSTKKYQGEVLRLATLCEKYSNHPIALALREKCDVTSEEISEYKEIAGKGVSCVYNNKKLLCGNARFLQELGVKVIDCDYLGSKLYLSVDGECAGVIVFNDKLRKTSRGCILELYDCGVENTVMLTGDNKDYAVKVRKELNMNKSVSELLPEDKVSELEKIMDEDKTSAVAFVGDGVNDAPVISRADVGFAMGGVGSDATVELSDVILTGDDLSKIPYAIKLAKRTSAIATQNLIVSLAVKFSVMFLSVFGITASLWLAIGADVGLLILTILNAVRNKINVV